jgi:apolipoprotein N-acyltransferase
LTGPWLSRALRLQLGAAALAGVATVAGFAPFGYSVLTVLGLAALALLWLRAAGPGPAAGLGFAFGLGFFCAGVSWVYVSLHDFGMMPLPLAVIATFLFCVILALFPAAAGFAWGRLRGHGGRAAAPLICAFPALWTLSEWCRGWVFTGFPWLGMGYAHTDSWLAGYAPLGGVHAVSLAAALCAGLLAYFLVTHSMRRRIAMIAVLAVVLAAGAALRLRDWTRPEGPPVTVALAQGDIPQSMKFDPERYESTLATYRRQVEQAVRVGAHLVVLPETAIPRLLDQVDPAWIDGLASTAATARADVLTGVVLRDRADRYYNAVISLGASPPQAYRKVHLVPFGEFIPPAFGWVLNILHIPLSDFARGPTDQQPLELAAGLRVAVNICYEDAFGDEIIRQLPRANLLTNASNVAWFGDSLAPEQHLQISRMRALETGRYMLRSTNTGVTAIIDEHGKVTARLPQFTATLLNGTAQPFTGATPFVLVGDGAVILLCLAMTVAAALLTRAAKRRAS